METRTDILNMSTRVMGLMSFGIILLIRDWETETKLLAMFLQIICAVFALKIIDANLMILISKIHNRAQMDFATNIEKVRVGFLHCRAHKVKFDVEATIGIPQFSGILANFCRYEYKLAFNEEFLRHLPELIISCR